MMNRFLFLDLLKTPLFLGYNFIIEYKIIKKNYEDTQLRLGNNKLTYPNLQITKL